MDLGQAQMKRLVRRVTPTAVRNHLLRAPTWSIGLYEGYGPDAFRPHKTIGNPVLTRDDVSDVDAAFVADPFALRVDGTWHLFFEVLNRSSGRGEIGLAVSDDLEHWSYAKIVLAEPFHLSYPLTFTHDGAIYMVPEASASGGVRLYRATRFPHEWDLESVIMTGNVLLDATLFEHDGAWWMLVDTSRRHTHDTLRLYHASSPAGHWSEHPASPLVDGDPTAARPAGRVVSVGGRLVRYAQDCAVRYGHRVQAFEILELTPRSYQERPIGRAVIAPGQDHWRRRAMHHVDAHEVDGRLLAFVDGH